MKYRPRLPEAVQNVSNKDRQTQERAQIRNQKQAAKAAGRGSRTIGGSTSSRDKPSRKF